MTCNTCGNIPNKPCGCKDYTRAVLEINNPEKAILLRKVVIPASLGDDTTVPATLGKYCNVVLYYEANKHVYLYSSDGIPTLLESEVPQEVIDRIEDLEAEDIRLQTEINTEEQARTSADEQLGADITAEATARTQAIADEASTRAAEDATLQNNIDAVASDLTDEASARADADTALGTRIDGVANDLATETSNRESADTTLQNNITAEETARTNADTTLQTNIDNLSTALTTETTNRTNADTALGTRIDGVAGDLATETTNRQTADNGLQSQIDAITASSDVKDIVGTYAALQQYDTSTLGDNDIIKVLQDETHQDETTYYRWSTSTNTFTLIGEEGPYYTKAATDTLLNAKADKTTTYTKTEVDTALATKQNTLTAGANVQISNDTISATDTTYSPFTGTDGTTAGTSGLVPAPATTDADKYLKSDGTWDTVQAGPTVVQTTGTSTINVMSQNAVTRMMYADPVTKYRIQIGLDATSSQSSGVAVGTSAAVTGRYGIAVGNGAKASGYASIALGWRNEQAGARGDSSIAIGSNTDATTDSTVAIGYGAQATVKGQFDISSTLAPTAGYNNSAYRLLTGLYDPQSAHDAATKGYVDTAVAGVGANEINSTDWSALWQ